MSAVGQAEESRQDDAKQAAQQPGPLRDQAGLQRDAAAQRRDESGFLRDEAANARPSRRPAGRAPGPATHRSSRPSGGAGCGLGSRACPPGPGRGRQGPRRRQARLDGLTGAFNREAGLLELGRDLARAARTEHMLVVMFVDVDHLKALNDTHGHAAGDRALIAVAETLLGALRPYDLVIRYGGDEFLCAVEGIDTRSARLRFAQIDRLLDEAVEGLTITVGLAQLQTGESSDDVIARADADLYRQRHQRSH